MIKSYGKLNILIRSLGCIDRKSNKTDLSKQKVCYKYIGYLIEIKAASEEQLESRIWTQAGDSVPLGALIICSEVHFWTNQDG